MAEPANEATRSQGERSGRVKWWVLTALGLVLIAGIVWWFRPLPSAKPKIGRETTYLTEPVRDDGTIDYLAALNDRLSEGVTPDNNAFIAIAYTMGRDDWRSAEKRRFVYRWLKVDPPPATLAQFVTYNTFADRHSLKPRPPATQPSEQFLNALEDQLQQSDAISPPSLNHWLKDQLPQGRAATQPDRTDQAHLPEGPWKPEAYPRVYAWLKRNKAALGRVAIALHRPKWYAPRGPGNSPFELAFPGDWLNHVEGIAEAYACRARYHLAKQQTRRAIRDVFSMLRLARHQGAHAGSLTEHLRALAIERRGFDVLAEIIGHGAPSAPDALWMEWAWTSLPRPKGLARIFDSGERIFNLALITAVWRRLNTVQSSDSSPIEMGAGLPTVHPGDYNPNPALRRINDFWDNVARLGRIKDYSKYQTVHRKLVDPVKFDVDVSWYRSWQGKLALAIGSSRMQRGLMTRLANHFLLLHLIPSVDNAYRTYWRTRMHRDLARLAIALGGYRAEHGQYPKELAALSPEWLNPVPKDLFVDEPVRYDRRGPGAVVIYSVGPDQKDNGGKEDDVVLRLGAAATPATQPASASTAPGLAVCAIAAAGGGRAEGVGAALAAVGSSAGGIGFWHEGPGVRPGAGDPAMATALAAGRGGPGTRRLALPPRRAARPADWGD